MTSASFAVTPSPAPAPLPFENPAVKPATPSVEIAEQIRNHGSVCLRVQGMSMFPWIRPGDWVFVRRCDFAAVRPGDVILYSREERYFVHRTLRRTGSFLITKGDALDGCDAPVSHQEFLGRAIRIHRGGRHIDVQSLGHAVAARILAALSPASFLLYRPLRFAKKILARPSNT